MKVKHTAVTLALAAVTAFGAVACTPSYPAGPAGKVTDRHERYAKATGWRYELTTTRTFRVTRSDYKDCVRGSSYPKCTSK